MNPSREWTGRDTIALRKALRLTTDGLASRLQVAPRTVANWSANPDMVPRVGIQDALDELLNRATPQAQARFAELVQDAPANEQHGHALRVAIAVVVDKDRVLLVRRREGDSGISWQFPAGIIKPGEHGEDVAVRETLGETGVHCSVLDLLGSRLHPVTEVHCDYYACDYLAGEAENRDTVENAGVVWARCGELSKFVTREMIYPPVLRFLEETRDPASR